MILIREVFRIKPDSMRVAKAAVKDMLAVESKYGNFNPRVLTDLTGEYFTLVMEAEAPSLADFEEAYRSLMGNDAWRAKYERFRPTLLGGRREIFQIEE